MSVRPLVCANCGAPLTRDDHAQVLQCSYCGQAHQVGHPAPISASPNAYGAGDAVCIEWGGRFWPGRVVRSAGSQRWEVAYDGWPAKWNEIVGTDRLSPLGPPPRSWTRWYIIGASVVAVIACALSLAATLGLTHGSGARAASSASAASAASAAPTESAAGDSAAGSRVLANAPHAGQPQPLVVGAAVDVEWQGRWYPAEVLALESNQRMRIHYIGWGPEWDEVVGPERVRPRHR